MGADFLKKFNLLVDIKNSALIDSVTQLQAQGSIKCINTPPGISLALPSDSPYSELLLEFKHLYTSNNNIEREISKVPVNFYHTISTTGPPVASRPRRLSPKYLGIVKKIINNLLEEGKIRLSKSPYAAPINLVEKSNNSYRVTCDFRLLNNITIKDKYSLPYLNDFTSNLNGCKIFSKLDLKDAFFQIPIDAKSIEKTAMITPIGLYEWTCMPQGLCNAAQTFQRYINFVLYDLDFVFCFVDDLLIYSENVESHIEHLRKVFERLSQFGLQIKISKCLIGVEQLKFLGFHVNSEGISPDEDKVTAIKDFPRPKTLRELQQFLGLVNFLRRFLQGAGSTLIPLTKLLGNSNKRKPNSALKWNEDAETAFIKIKNDVANATLLAHPKSYCPLRLITDASNIGTGAILQQHSSDEWLTLGFFSHAFRGAELNYSTFSKELLAIFLAIKHFKYMLEGSTFHVLTDCKAILGAHASYSTRHSPREARALEFIGQYTNDIRHIQGTSNASDALSRAPVQTAREDLQFPCNNTISSIQNPNNFNTLSTLPSFAIINYETLARDQKNDPELHALQTDPNTSLTLHTIKLPSSNESVICDLSQGIVRPYLTQDFRKLVFNNIHNLAHAGFRSTFKLISDRFVWKYMRRDVRSWARNCISCQKN